MPQYFGKYRGTVVNNLDPLQKGRVQVNVPAVLGLDVMSWAMPCVPYGGLLVGQFTIPPLGANIWVEFEGGDPEQPIWTGCFWAAGETPILPALALVKAFKTLGCTLKLDDTPGIGGITLEVGLPLVVPPVTLKMGATGLEIRHGKNSIRVTAASVSINDGALDII